MITTFIKLEPVQSSYHPDIFSKICVYVPTLCFTKLPYHHVSDFPKS